jgi:hypothetical protein
MQIGDQLPFEVDARGGWWNSAMLEGRSAMNAGPVATDDQPGWPWARI